MAAGRCTWRPSSARPFSAATGWLEARGEDIQLDEALLAALPDKYRQLVRSLDPRGRADLYWRDLARRAGRGTAPAPAGAAEAMLAAI